MSFVRFLALLACFPISFSCLAEEAQVNKRRIELFSAGAPVAELVVFGEEGVSFHADHVENRADASTLLSGHVQISANSGGNRHLALKCGEAVVTKSVVSADEMKAVRDLEAMEASDQSIRVRWPKLSDEDIAKMNEIDRANLKRLTEIVERYGWPGFSFAGLAGANSAFLVIQHTEDLQAQKKYLPLLRAAVQRNEAEPAQLALLEDRVRVRSGLPQLYGSQLDGSLKLSPIEDEAHVDQRRKAMGLEPLADYLKRFKQ